MIHGAEFSMSDALRGFHSGDRRAVSLDAAPSWQRSLRYRKQYSRHSHQIIRCHRQLEVLISPFDAAIERLSKAAHGLAPTSPRFQ